MKWRNRKKHGREYGVGTPKIILPFSAIFTGGVDSMGGKVFCILRPLSLVYYLSFVDMRKALSGLMLSLIALSSAFTISGAFAGEIKAQEVQVQEVQVQHTDDGLFDKIKNSVVPKTEAYTFSMTDGLTVEQADVDTVGEQAGVGAMSYLQILKFLGIGILITVTGLIVNKVFGLVKFG